MSAVLISALIAGGIAILSAFVATYKLSIDHSKDYTNLQVGAVKELYSEKVTDLKKDIQELKDEVRELRDENKQQTKQIIKLLTIVAKGSEEDPK